MLIYEEIARLHPSLSSGKVWCRTCGREETVNSARALETGWPKCHSLTMTIDDPETWSKDLPRQTERK